MKYKHIQYKYLFYTINLIVVLSLLPNNIYANDEQGFIDTVYSYQFTDSQTIGQSEEFFPENIFGPPSKFASETTQAASDIEVVSIGRNGWLIVGFKNKYVIDGEGTDFTIFENAFINNATKKIFAEPAKVAVSQDGINYIEFPYDEETLQGCAGINPVYGLNNPYDPTQSGGDKFDLKDIGLTYAKYIKITDISLLVTKDPKHKYYQPEAMILGFDLDAVAGLHLSENTMNIQETDDILQIIQKQNAILINNNSSYDFELNLYNYLGGCLHKINILSHSSSHIQNLQSGLYYINAISKHRIIKKKIVVSL